MLLCVSRSFEHERVCVCAVHSGGSAPSVGLQLHRDSGSPVAARWETPTAPVTRAGLRGLTGLHLTPCLRVCE